VEEGSKPFSPQDLNPKVVTIKMTLLGMRRHVERYGAPSHAVYKCLMCSRILATHRRAVHFPDNRSRSSHLQRMKHDFGIKGANNHAVYRSLDDVGYAGHLRGNRGTIVIDDDRMQTSTRSKSNGSEHLLIGQWNPSSKRQARVWAATFVPSAITPGSRPTERRRHPLK